MLIHNDLRLCPFVEFDALLLIVLRLRRALKRSDGQQHTPNRQTFRWRNFRKPRGRAQATDSRPLGAPRALMRTVYSFTNCFQPAMPRALRMSADTGNSFGAGMEPVASSVAWNWVALVSLSYALVCFGNSFPARRNTPLRKNSGLRFRLPKFAQASIHVSIFSISPRPQ